jgi:RimJ/RimL family protein N-acetyltransferase
VTLKAAERFESTRLVFRRPVVDDDRSMLERYAGDVEVTRYLGWPRHTSVADTRAFLAVSDAGCLRQSLLIVRSRARRRGWPPRYT